MGFRDLIPKSLDSKTECKEQLKKIFKKYDSNHDNCLSKEELKRAFDELGALFPGFRARRGLYHADANNDGQIDMGELDNLLDYAYKHGFTGN
ncbi:unnamed protein product [Dovyalis caffra]|uniref:EF-hand domain-containing protein n=1 Tax=Dovyalis caffra TaxID=77055 RepID=A0AAV1RSQ2_9ROSI|nr:unnamed protein product [Dovyalis caffra]